MKVIARCETGESNLKVHRKSNHGVPTRSLKIAKETDSCWALGEWRRASVTNTWRAAHIGVVVELVEHEIGDVCTRNSTRQNIVPYVLAVPIFASRRSV